MFQQITSAIIRAEIKNKTKYND